MLQEVKSIISEPEPEQSKPKESAKAATQKQQYRPTALIVILILTVSGFLCFVNCLLEVTSDTSYHWQSPIKFQNIVRGEQKLNYVPAKQGANEIEKISKIIFPEAKAAGIEPEPVAEQLTADQLVYKIYGLESTWGKVDGCTAKGLYNGYGFRQNTREHKCFESRETVRLLVVNWVKEKRALGYSDAELLCYYNTGYKVSDCTYYKNSLKI